MQEDEIAAYLKAHPEFFEKNASLLADIHLPSPHGSGAISLAERQQFAQRDKIAALEERYIELVHNAKENDEIANKMHSLFVSLQQAKDFNAVAQLVSEQLVTDFNITTSRLRIWPDVVDDTNLSEADEQTRTWVTDIHNVYCGKLPTSIPVDDWFDESIQSVAILPLKHTETYGYLVLASDQDKRFYVGMGTDFLQKLSDHISAAFARYLST